MVIDTSAVVAILFNEEDALAFERAIAGDPVRLISASTFVETALVMERRYGDAGARELDLLMYKTRLEIAPVDAAQAEIARSALRRFGKGRHPAALNFGDCFAYALSKATGEPLLFKGDDFAQTDVVRAPV